MACDSEPRKFFEASKTPPDHQGIKMFFDCNYSTKNTCKLQ